MLLFEILSFTQLFLIPSWATLSAVNAVTQQKDRRTFILLLLTDLRNHEIVLGKLLGSLLPIALLLLASVPFLLLLLLLGGVAPAQVAGVLVIVAGTSLAAGSMGGLVALWRDH